MRYFYFFLNMLLVPVHFILCLSFYIPNAFSRAYWETIEAIKETKMNTFVFKTAPKFWHTLPPHNYTMQNIKKIF